MRMGEMRGDGNEGNGWDGDIRGVFGVFRGVSPSVPAF